PGEREVVAVGGAVEQALGATLPAQEQGVGVFGVDVRQGDLLDETPAGGVFVEEDEVARAAEVHAAVAALDGDEVSRGERLRGGLDEGDPVRGGWGGGGGRRARGRRGVRGGAGT